MKIYLPLILAVVLVSCSNPDKADNEIKENPAENINSTVGVESDQNIQQSDSETGAENENWLMPNYLTADFNNDNQPDTAFAVMIAGKKGIRIKHGGKDEEFTIGAGNQFGNGGDDFYWVDSWKLVKEPSTFQTTFTEDGDVLGFEEVELKSTAFLIENDELGGATVAWINGEYVWIHQAD